LCWDPGAQRQLALPAAEMPVNIGEVDSKFMVQTVDLFMESAHDFVRVLCFDAHGSHQSIRRIMFGHPEERDRTVLFLG